MCDALLKLYDESARVFPSIFISSKTGKVQGQVEWLLLQFILCYHYMLSTTSIAQTIVSPLQPFSGVHDNKNALQQKRPPTKTPSNKNALQQKPIIHCSVPQWCCK
jgi:hypothetical protein